MARQYGRLVPDLEKAYGITGDADVTAATLALGRNITFSWHMRQWARHTVGAGSTAYLYYFTHTPPGPRAAELRAFHAGELPYVFNVVPSADPRETGFVYTDADTMLADRISSYWVNFVLTGDPNGGKLPLWPPYTLDTEPYLELAPEIRTGTHLLQAQLDFLDKAQLPAR
jgi:para-nitrobenzyl esterase